MLPQELDQPLAQIELQLDSLAEAVGQGDALRLEAVSASLQRISLELAQLVEGRYEALASPQSRRRLQRISDLMAIQRESLIRQAASVERTLGVLIPATKSATTYGKPLGAPRYLA